MVDSDKILEIDIMKNIDECINIIEDTIFDLTINKEGEELFDENNLE